MCNFFRIISLLLVCLVCFAQAQTQISDPTKPLNFAVAAGGVAGRVEEKISVTSILIASDRKVVVINGQVLQEQQNIKGVGALVKKIDADAVTLQQNGKVWRVYLSSALIRQ